MHYSLRNSSHDRHLGAIGEIDDRIALEQQSFSSFDRNDAQPCFDSGANRFDTNHRHIETHVLFWFGHFDHYRAFACEGAAAFDGVVRSFNSFNRNDSAILNDDRLSDVESRDFFGDSPAEIDVVFFVPRYLWTSN